MLDRINDREFIGGNNPPGPIDHAREAMAELSKFTENCPVIQDFDDAKQAAAWIERTRIALQSMEDERKPIVDPPGRCFVVSIGGRFFHSSDGRRGDGSRPGDDFRLDELGSAG